MKNLPPKQVIPIYWQGQSKSYAFQLDEIGTVYKAIPGVYIFTKQALNGKWDALYVGETDNFRRRLSDELLSHHQWQSVRRCGATHICTMHVPTDTLLGAALRVQIETELRHKLKPTCNLQ